MKWLAALLALTGSACSGEPAEGPLQGQGGGKAPAVHLPQYRPPGAGGPEAFMEAGMGGILRLEGRCLGFAGASPGSLMTIVWPSEARLGSDERGPFVAIGEERWRPGDDLKGGGGSLPTDFNDAVLTRPFPAECDRSSAVQFHSIERAGTAPSPQPAVNPPPPPAAPTPR